MPVMKRTAPLDVAATASRLPAPVQRPAGMVLQALADLLGADTIANPSTPDVSMVAPTPLMAAKPTWAIPFEKAAPKSKNFVFRPLWEQMRLPFDAAKTRVTKALAMDPASKAARAKDLGFTTDVYHLTRSPDADWQEFFPMGGMNVAHEVPGVHVGTLAAADQRGRKWYGLKNWNQFNPDVGHMRRERGGTPSILPLKMKMERPFLKAGGQPYTESELRTLVKQRFQDSRQDFMEFLKARGYDTIPYVNAVEDRGSVSYLVLRPQNLRSIFAKFDPRDIDSKNLFAAIGGAAAAGSLKGVTPSRGETR